MKSSVTAILVCEDELFVIQRAHHLGAFPGFHSFPGGKVDATDSESLPAGEIFKGHEGQKIQALTREVQEELAVDLIAINEKSEILSLDYLTTATSPDFHHKRFKNHVYRIELKSKPDMKIDEGEIANGKWMSSSDLQKLSMNGQLMAVPPIRKVIKKLAENLFFKEELDVDLKYDNELEVPEVEILEGVKTLLVRSNTLPPADRTNCFVLGDKSKVVVDPSPKDEKELERLVFSLKKYQVSDILITHHHGDHHQLSAQLAKILGVGIKLSEDTLARIESKWGENYFDGVKTHKLVEGESVCQVLGENVLVLAVPGHDEGQLALYKESWDWCIVGDLIQTVGTVVIGGPEGDMKKYFKSLENVISHKPNFVFPSHGLGVGGTFRLEETLKHRKMREEQVLKYLKENKTEEEILKAIYPDLDETLHVYAIKTIEAHIKKLKEEERA